MEARKASKFVIGLVLVTLGAFLLTSLFTHDPREGPFPDFSAEQCEGNTCGAAGAYVSAYALALFGWDAYLLAGIVTLGGLALLARLKVRAFPMRLAGVVLLAAVALLGLAIANASPTSTASSYEAHSGVGGGLVGILLAGALYRLVGSTGTFILFLFSGCLGTFLFAGAEMAAACAAIAARAKALGRAALSLPRWSLRRRPAFEVVDGVSPEPVPAPAAGRPDEVEAAREDIETPAEPEQYEVAPEPMREEPEVVTRHIKAEPDIEDEEPEFELLEGGEPDGEYRLPSINLLDECVGTTAGEDEDEIRQKGRLLERTLGEFKVDAQVVRVRRGPVITMYELSLSAGTKVSKVESLSDDLAIALKAPNVRIVAPLPGKNTVGIEVPNTERDLVGIRELMEELGKKAMNMAVPLFLGRDTAGNPLVLDLATCPHLLVAGATGSGKTVAINAMICSILMTRRPDEVQLLLVDPKSVEFPQYNRLPHLLCPVLSDMKKAASVLKWACKKMDERYAFLSRVGGRDLTGYNELGEDEIRRRLDPDGEADLTGVPFHMPHIVIFVDEFGELMMVAAKEVESSVIRLSQKARAVGIHLICATQRPSVDAITGLIKSNLPARLAFQVASKVDSRTILDRNGAELLLGRGDMLLLPPGTSRLIRAQGVYVSEEELQRIVGFVQAQGKPQFRDDLREHHAREDRAGSSDELYEDAVRVILETQRGSVSLLQRRLSVGYSRAARLIDMMADAGILGPYAGSQARDVHMTLEQWEKARSEA
ncbi:MAG: DNA translocase FtsK [Candidatus Brocadiae bacterium]|nr:DNA translocase FtsK [Candidatus Brocadiia bacterium]